MTDPITIQWTPAGGLPRRITFEPHEEGYHRIEQEWNGTNWRHCGLESVTDCTLTAPPTPEPAEPPTLQELLTTIRDTWTDPDPQVLLFEPPTEYEAVAAIDGELRHRNAHRTTVHTITEAHLEHHLQSSGLPSIRPLSETPFERAQFTESPLSTHS
ncbi:hypothetical protein [Natrialba sp. INN-245]|uniref:hypothetical protein n=1 Tax=Natrialba sp. INN-245 TaxID=2690967 RepID=UPI00131398E0|nr:hypothetical protein [Natrialba sp. INN-245]MWV40061.1 hypothetical protein [Natrialba sp. INN-245]